MVQDVFIIKHCQGNQLALLWTPTPFCTRQSGRRLWKEKMACSNSTRTCCAGASEKERKTRVLRGKKGEVLMYIYILCTLYTFFALDHVDVWAEFHSEITSLPHVLCCGFCSGILGGWREWSPTQWGTRTFCCVVQGHFALIHQDALFLGPFDNFFSLTRRACPFEYGILRSPPFFAKAR